MSKANHIKPKHGESHMVGDLNWIRAGVLGANDGIVSIAALVIGLLSAKSVSYNNLWIAGLSALVAGAFSMGIGEYVSVASQLDIETANIKQEKTELEEEPEDELHELAAIYRHRGLSSDLSLQVAKELTEHNALEAHLRDELGISEHHLAKPKQAAFISFFAFCIGGALPLICAIFVKSISDNIHIGYISIVGLVSVLTLLGLGLVSANIGGSPVKKAVVRILVGGICAFTISAFFGYWIGN